MCEVDVVLPNVVMARLTRASAMNAFKVGVSAERLLSFLEEHAHPAMVESARQAKRAQALPDVVTQWVRLWERQALRIFCVRVAKVSMSPELEHSGRKFVPMGKFAWVEDESRGLPIMIRAQDEAALTLLAEFAKHKNIEYAPVQGTGSCADWFGLLLREPQSTRVLFNDVVHHLMRIDRSTDVEQSRAKQGGRA
jgi:hypothetical protein